MSTDIQVTMTIPSERLGQPEYWLLTIEVTEEQGDTPVRMTRPMEGDLVSGFLELTHGAHWASLLFAHRITPEQYAAMK